MFANTVRAPSISWETQYSFLNFSVLILKLKNLYFISVFNIKNPWSSIAECLRRISKQVGKMIDPLHQNQHLLRVTVTFTTVQVKVLLPPSKPYWSRDAFPVWSDSSLKVSWKKEHFLHCWIKLNLMLFETPPINKNYYSLTNNVIFVQLGSIFII